MNASSWRVCLFVSWPLLTDCPVARPTSHWPVTNYCPSRWYIARVQSLLKPLVTWLYASLVLSLLLFMARVMTSHWTRKECPHKPQVLETVSWNKISKCNYLPIDNNILRTDRRCVKSNIYQSICINNNCKAYFLFLVEKLFASSRFLKWTIV